MGDDLHMRFKRTGLIMGGVAAVVLAITAIAILLGTIGSRNGQPPSDEQQVRDTITSLYDAYNRNDLADYQSHLCGDLLAVFATASLDKLNSSGVQVTTTIDSVRVDHDTASAVVTEQVPQPTGNVERRTVAHSLERHDGEWKICHTTLRGD
jgi:hypothetical protein